MKLNKKAFFVFLAFLLTLTSLSSPIFAESNTTTHKNKHHKKWKMEQKEYYHANGEKFYDYIPKKIKKKHKKTIKEVDAILSKQPGSMTSKSKYFSLNLYRKMIHLAVDTKDEHFAKRVNALTSDIGKHTIKKKKKHRFVKATTSDGERLKQNSPPLP